MPLVALPWRPYAATISLAACLVLGASNAWATKRAVLALVAFDVPDDFKSIAGPPPLLREEASGITLQVTELPPQALQEFKGPSFLKFLASLGYTDPAYADGALKRSDTHTYVLAGVRGEKGPESRFLLVLGGSGRAAIVTASVPKSEIDAGRASRAAIEAILSSAAIVPAGAKTP